MGVLGIPRENNEAIAALLTAARRGHEALFSGSAVPGSQRNICAGSRVLQERQLEGLLESIQPRGGRRRRRQTKSSNSHLRIQPGDADCLPQTVACTYAVVAAGPKREGHRDDLLFLTTT